MSKFQKLAASSICVTGQFGRLAPDVVARFWRLKVSTQGTDYQVAVFSVVQPHVLGDVISVCIAVGLYHCGRACHTRY